MHLIKHLAAVRLRQQAAVLVAALQVAAPVPGELHGRLYTRATQVDVGGHGMQRGRFDDIIGNPGEAALQRGRVNRNAHLIAAAAFIYSKEALTGHAGLRCVMKIHPKKVRHAPNKRQEKQATDNDARNGPHRQTLACRRGCGNTRDSCRVWSKVHFYLPRLIRPMHIYI